MGIVGILFSNLFIGIIIQTFQQTEEDRKTYHGELDLIFSWHESSIAAEQRAQVYKKLGHVAAIIHDPVMSTLEGVRIMRHKFFHQIAAFEGNIDKWAVTKCQRQFRHRR